MLHHSCSRIGGALILRPSYFPREIFGVFNIVLPVPFATDRDTALPLPRDADAPHGVTETMIQSVVRSSREASKVK